MNTDYELEVTDLALGLTKPPTKLGVPMIGFYLSIICCFFAWMFCQTLIGSTSILSIIAFMVLWLGIYGGMAYATFKDPFGLTIFWLNLTSFKTHPTHAFWGNTDSYAP